MNPARSLLMLSALGTAWSFVGQPAAGQDLPPLDDRATQPLSTPAISEFDVELFGKLAHIWRLSDGTDVIQYYGDFTLHMGPRRMSSQDAVVWMRSGDYEGTPYQQFEVFLWRDARVVEPGGAVTTAPLLFVTLQSFGTVSANYDAKTEAPSEDSALYLRAARVREDFSPFRTPLYAKESPMEIRRPAEEEGAPPPTAHPVMIRLGRTMETHVRDDQERLLVAGGGVYIARGTGRSEEFLEIRAENAVLYLLEQAVQGQIRRGLEEEEPSEDELERALTEEEEAAAVQELLASPAMMDMGAAGEVLSGVYLEGDVVLSRGERTVRASRLFYDFQNDRALILDAVMRSPVPERNLPIYVRAEQVRQLSSREYLARDAVISTSEFRTPHYAVGADKVYLYDRTLGQPGGQVMGLIAGTYKAYHTTLKVDGTPVLYWPYSRGDFKQSESVLKRVAAGYRDDWGATLETEWYLSNLLGLEQPDGFESTLLLDYFSDRGPAAGVDVDYERDSYYGLFRSYYVSDRGEDNLGGLRDDLEPAHDNRGRVLWRHRQYLPKDWELTLEASYISDSNFLESYYESEFDEDKEQETLIYLKKQRDNWAVTALAKWQILSWIETTEHLPEVSFFWVGQPLGEWGSYFNESRLGAVRRRTDQRWYFEGDRPDNLARTDVTARADTRQEVDVPLSLGPVKVVPFAVVRGTTWDGDEPGAGGNVSRLFGQYGVRSSMYLSRTFDDVRSELFDINGLRHVIKPDVIAWWAHSNEDSADLTPFSDGIEDIDDFGGVTVGVRQRLQTQRGAEDNMRVVDWMTLDIEAGFFNNVHDRNWLTRGRTFASRPENSITSNYISANYIWRISDSTALLTDLIFDMDHFRVGTWNASLAVERSPRFGYFVGYRYINRIRSNLLGAGVNYKISRKHTIALRDWFDLDRGENGGLEIAYIRKFPRWYVGVTFEIDDTRDQTGISISAWPEGLPSVAIGGRRYTGIAETVAIHE
ncbi:MAG: LPS assembly protein LptD [Phycisphaerales bacterium]|nr:MAG: LPS assembly protein LptD [Phycisphaerales bacterium]